MKIKELIEELKKDPEEILTSLDEDNLKKLIEYISNKYYEKNESLISDQLYDYVKEFYDKNFNKSKKSKVGTHSTTISAKNKDKVKLPYYMGSLDKIKPSTNTFNKWIAEFPGPYVISYKLDGISALLYKNNNKVHMYTRGNGLEGQDISNIIEHIGINITNLVNGDAIRGELIMSKENFKKIKDQMANSRNAVAGIINTKIPNIQMLKLIDFVPYWVLSPALTQSEQMAYIESKNFKPKSVDYVVKKQITTEDLSDLLLKARTNYKYEIDGIVVIDDSKYYPIIPNENPAYGFAFKQVLTDQIAESTVIDVIWEISKDGYIKPKIKIDTVELLGSEITYATAFNAKYIVDNVIGPGSRVKIIKSGDVIPYIMEILSKSDSQEPKMPSFEYEWNDTDVDIIAINLDDANMEKLIVKKLTYFFTALDIKFMGEGTVSKFVANGYDDLWKILSADKEKLKKIDGLGAKSVDKIYESIESGLTNQKIYNIMSASQIFGRGIGSRKLKLITDAYPNIMDIFKSKGKDHTVQLINAISGFDVKTTNKVVDSMDSFIEYYKKLIKIKPNVIQAVEETDLADDMDVDKPSKSNKSSKSNTENKYTKYAGKTIVFTGFRVKEVEAELEKAGAKITTSVSKNTNLVIAADPEEESSKIVKANELGIEVLSKDAFLKTLE